MATPTTIGRNNSSAPIRPSRTWSYPWRWRASAPRLSLPSTPARRPVRGTTVSHECCSVKNIARCSGLRPITDFLTTDGSDGHGCKDNEPGTGNRELIFSHKEHKDHRRKGDPLSLMVAWIPCPLIACQILSSIFNSGRSRSWMAEHDTEFWLAVCQRPMSLAPIRAHL